MVLVVVFALVKLYIIHNELQCIISPLGISEEGVRIDRVGTIHPRYLTPRSILTC